jgi:hypothetical protein
VIHNRRFWWLYPDGRMGAVRLTPRIVAGLQQTRGTETRNAANDDAPPPRPYREIGPRGPCKLPPHNLVTDKTVKELAMEYGWESTDRFRQAIRKSRPQVHALALANGRARRAAAMPRAMRRMQNRARAVEEITP